MYMTLQDNVIITELLKIINKEIWCKQTYSEDFYIGLLDILLFWRIVHSAS